MLKAVKTKQQCSSSAEIVKAFQKILVYEPLEDQECRVCDRVRPYPSAPPFGTSIKLCTYKEMEHMCFPKLCDCPHKEIPSSFQMNKAETIRKWINVLAGVCLIATLYDMGFFRHPSFTALFTDKIGDFVRSHFNSKGEEKQDAKREYDMVVKRYNIINVWNTIVVGIGNILLMTFVHLPKEGIKYSKEILAGGNDGNEDGHKKSESS